MATGYTLLGSVLNSGGAGMSLEMIAYLVFVTMVTFAGVVLASVIIFVGGTYVFGSLGQDSTSTQMDTPEGSDEPTTSERE